MNIKAIIFDLGRVLIDVDLNRGLFPLLINHSSNQPLALQEKLAVLFRNPLFRRFNTGQISAQDFYRQISDRFGLTFSYPEFVHRWCDIFSEIEGMEQLVNQLTGKYRLGLLSDTDPLHWNFCVRRFSFLKLFPRPTLSFQTGWLKPHPNSYRLAAEHVGLPADRCLLIDDRPVNVEGAQKIGMHALLFDNSHQLKKELIFLGLI